MTDALQRDAEQLSSFIDGEVTAADVERVCARWRAAESAQATWHAYHLIGDVLRSEDLANSPGRDRLVLAQLRRRLANESVHIAPQNSVKSPAPRAAANPRIRNWGALAAVAAGFAAVTGVLVVLRTPVGSDASGPGQVAAPSMAAPTAVAAAPRPLDREQLILAADGKLLRDVRLDRYLDAHKHFSGSSALGVPSSFLRGATSDASNR